MKDRWVGWVGWTEEKKALFEKKVNKEKVKEELKREAAEIKKKLKRNEDEEFEKELAKFVYSEEGYSEEKGEGEGDRKEGEVNKVCL